MKLIFSILVLLVFFVGCGGGGGGSGSISSLFSGKFIDAKVQGLDYNCSSGMSGTTDAEGTFTCRSGDTIKFYAKGTFIGSALVDDILSPYSLWSGNNEVAVNVAQLLQTVDSDASSGLIVIGVVPANLLIDSPTFDTDFNISVAGSMVSNSDAQDSMDVFLDVEDLSFNDIKNQNSSENNVSSNLALITNGTHGTDINWSSSNGTYLSNGGVVTKPTYTQGSPNIIFTATVSKGSKSTSKEFNLTILSLPMTNLEMVTLDYNALNFDDIKVGNTIQTNVLTDLNLVTSGENGSSISWESNDTVHLTTSGVVTRPPIGSVDVNATLTSTIFNSTHTQIKTFIVTIKAITSYDEDNDFIPDDIENMLGLDSSNDDENGNGIADGIDPDFGDTFYKNQWHLKARGTVVNNTAGVATVTGNDLGLDSVYSRYMGYNQGAPIIVSVVDNGTDADHEDLAANMDLTRSRNAANGTTDPSPTGDETHGTMVAGIIAARGFNDKGVRGIAPFAKIAGNNWLSNQTYAELEKAWVTGAGANEIAVCNNSWGSEYDNETLTTDLLKVGATTLRDGKGRIYVKAAGNSRDNRNGYEDEGNSNLSNSSNNRYIIAVAALKHDNTHASYSSFGSNILISGYSGDYYNTAPTIGTTNVSGDTSLPTWDDDTNHNYTYAMNGTSAAAPTVSGAIALILEACPNLAYRDIKYILSKTATVVDSSNTNWKQNSSGLKHSIDYGYGLINTSSAINMCRNGYTNLSQEKISTNTVSFNEDIPDNDNIGKSFTIPINDNFLVEWIGLYVDVHTHTWQGDLEMYITSPAGTVTQLIQGNNVLKSQGATNSGFYNSNGRLGSSAFIDENSNGNWIVTIKDLAGLDTGTVEDIKLEVVGH